MGQCFYRSGGLLPKLYQPYKPNWGTTTAIFNAISILSTSTTSIGPQSGDMPLLRPQYTSRLLQARVVAHQRMTPSYVRWASQTSSGEYHDRSIQPAPKSDVSTSPAPTPGDSSMITQQDSREAMVDHQPDYHAPIDHATS